MRRLSLLGRAALALFIVAGIAACGSPAAPGGPAAATTINPAAAPTAAPTSTLAPTVEVLAARPEVAEALAMIADARYEEAVSTLRPIYLRASREGGSSDELAELQEQLAGAYLAWGRATVSASGGDMREISIAYDHFNSGVTIVSSESSTRAELVAERDLAGAVIEAGLTFNQLADGLAADPQATVEEVVAALAAVRERRPDYPGLMPLQYNALIGAAATYKDAPAETPDGQMANLKAALGHCEAAAALDPVREEATDCVKAMSARIAALTATPTPVAVQRKLRFRVINYNDDPSCISVQVAKISTSGWFFTVDGVRGLRGNFDNAGNSRLCGLSQGQEVTITVFDGKGRAVSGGAGVPAKGSAIMGAEWR